jgi:hypothetical protein
MQDKSPQMNPLPETGRDRAQETFIKLVLVLLIACHVAAAAIVCVNRLSRPVLIDGMEDCIARFAYHMSEGHDVYGPISTQIERLMYTPLSVHVNACAIKLFGLDIRIQRAVVLFFSLGSLIMLGLCVKKLTGNSFLGWVGAGLLLGIDVGYWYILLGPNSMHVFFSLAGLFFLLRKEKLTWLDSLMAMLCFFAGFWSKQTGLAYIVAGLFYILMKDWRKGAGSALFTVLLVAASIGYYAAKPGSMFLFNCFQWMTYDRIIWSRFLNPLLFPELLGRFGVLTAIVLAGIFFIRPSFKNYLQPQYVLLGASAFAGPFAAMKYGSGNVQCILFYAMLIACGLAFLSQFIKENRISSHLALILLVIQAAALIHSISVYCITDEDEQRFGKVQSILAEHGKTGYYYAHGYHNVLVGKPPFVNLSRDPEHERQFGRIGYPPVITQFWQRNPFDTIISFYPWEDNTPLMLEQLQKAYTLAEDIPPAVNHPNSTELRKRLLVFKRKQDVQP